MGVSCAPADGVVETAITGGQSLRPFEIQVPGDPSTAAFFQVAAALVPGSDLRTPGLSLNPTRIGALDVLRRAGVGVEISNRQGPPGGEPLGDVRITQAPLQPFVITGPEVPALVDEIPILAVLATAAPGKSRITGAAELRVKESDRLTMTATNLVQLGATVDELPDGLRLSGPTPLRGGSNDVPLMLSTAGDHRMAMAMAVAALVSEGAITLDDFACVAVSFPHFFATFATILGDGISDRPF